MKRIIKHIAYKWHQRWINYHVMMAENYELDSFWHYYHSTMTMYHWEKVDC